MRIGINSPTSQALTREEYLRRLASEKSKVKRHDSVHATSVMFRATKLS